MQHSRTRQVKQKICANLDNHWSIKCSFLCVQTNWVRPSGTQRYCKDDSYLSLESLTVTRVESSHHFFSTWLESSPRHHNRDSSRIIDSSYAITAFCSGDFWGAFLRAWPSILISTPMHVISVSVSNGSVNSLSTYNLQHLHLQNKKHLAIYVIFFSADSSRCS